MTDMPAAAGSGRAPGRAEPGLILRHDLVAALSRAAQKQVTIISAPAGTGKTSLLRAWAGRPGQDCRVAFLTVRPGQHDMQLFWLTVLGAIRAAEGTGDGCAQLPPVTPGASGSALVDKVLSELEASAPVDRRPVWVNIRSIPDVDYPVLYAHAPALLSLNIEQQATEVSFGFGMLPSSVLGLAGDGVVFRILGKKDIGGDEEVLYEKRLDPAHNSNDIGRHAGKVSFAAGQYKRLIYETNPGPAGNTAYDQAYWSDVIVR